jgi:hypothetical protein
MKTPEKDLRSQRRQTESNPPVFNDFCAYFGKIYGYGFSRDNMQRVPNWDLSSIAKLRWYTGTAEEGEREETREDDGYVPCSRSALSAFICG